MENIRVPCAYYGLMGAEFRSAGITDLDRIVPMMSRLYAQDGLTFDAEGARCVAEWLAAHPEHGQIRIIEADGEVAGYIALTVGVSLEYGA